MEISESRAEQAGGIILGVFSLLLYFVIIPAEIADVRGMGVSPRFMPQAVGILLFILAVSLFISGYRKRDRQGQKTYSLSRHEAKLVVKSLAVVAAYIVAFDMVGYLIPTIVVLGLLMYMYGQRKKKVLFSVALGLPVMIYLFFTKVLHMVLP
ncbi:tripartite tricarboxylate transporter TctB family protein [Anaeroselena agilis]|uniref:Tripartite tricarboxylate transporter TctB family protein n=1 Tax=Anaeroselena agilis TaxID=3063788 RepID=A0ABU3P330_9FIRM|nr:tripartite tricarboxylate transporter TctB family protein [Selenomonadales bacterium 4137-cl]